MIQPLHRKRWSTDLHVLDALSRQEALTTIFANNARPLPFVHSIREINEIFATARVEINEAATRELNTQPFVRARTNRMVSNLRSQDHTEIPCLNVCFKHGIFIIFGQQQLTLLRYTIFFNRLNTRLVAWMSIKRCVMRNP